MRRALIGANLAAVGLSIVCVYAFESEKARVRHEIDRNNQEMLASCRRAVFREVGYDLRVRQFANERNEQTDDGFEIVGDVTWISIKGGDVHSLYFCWTSDRSGRWTVTKLLMSPSVDSGNR